MSNKDNGMKIFSLTNYLIELPNPKRTNLITLLVSIIVGIIGYVFLEKTFVIENIFLYGSLMGIMLIGVPAILSSIITTSVSRFSRKELILRRSSYLSFFSVLILSVIYLLGTFISFLGTHLVFDLLIFGYVLVFAARIFILNITYPYNLIQTISISSIHPFLGFFFIYLSPYFLNPELLFIPSIMPAILLLKAGLALLVLAVGVVFFILLVNAPMKRNFDIKTMKLTKSFLSHWLDKTSSIEETLKPMAEKADVLIGIMVFKTKKKLKSLFIVPYVHPGPFGEIGGSLLTKVFTDRIRKKKDVEIFIPHGIATHDLNPLDRKSLHKISNRIVDEFNGLKFSKYGSKSIRNKYGKAKVMGQRFGDGAFLVSTFSPNATEDIDFSIGLAVMNKLEKNFNPVLYADAHNCHQSGHHTIFSGDPIVFDLMDSMEKAGTKLSKQRRTSIKQGIGSDPLSEYTPKDGVGPTGLKVSIFEVGKQKTAYVIFDANNMAAGLREKIMKAVEKLGIDEVEVMTTDSHCVNNIKGIENPIGKIVDQDELVERAVKACEKALDDLETVSVGTKMFKVKNINVLGSQRATELISTVNSMVAIMKIIAPIIFGTALFLSLLSVLLIPW